MGLADDMRELRSVPFFAALADEQLRLIAFSCEARTCPPRTVLAGQGEPLDSAFVLVSGRLAAEREGRAGRRARVIAPPALLGGRALVVPATAFESLVVEERASLLQIRRAAFRRLLEEYPQVAADLRRRLAELLARAGADYRRAAGRLARVAGQEA